MTSGTQGIAPPSVTLPDDEPVSCFRCPLESLTPATRTIDSDGGLLGLCESCFADLACAEVTPQGWILPAERSLPERALPCAGCRAKAIRRADSDGLPLGLCGECFSVFDEQGQFPAPAIMRHADRFPASSSPIGLTNPPYAITDRQVEETGPPSLPAARVADRRVIGFAPPTTILGVGFTNSEILVSNVAQNVAPATNECGPGHVSDADLGHIPEVVSNLDWESIRVPDRGEGKSFSSGPIYWKFRTDRECWRVQFKPTLDAVPFDLGNLGKRELKKLDALPDDERHAAILVMVRGWMREKGITP